MCTKIRITKQMSNTTACLEIKTALTTQEQERLDSYLCGDLSDSLSKVEITPQKQPETCKVEEYSVNVGQDVQSISPNSQIKELLTEKPKTAHLQIVIPASASDVVVTETAGVAPQETTLTALPEKVDQGLLKADLLERVRSKLGLSPDYLEISSPVGSNTPQLSQKRSTDDICEYGTLYNLISPEHQPQNYGSDYDAKSPTTPPVR